MRDGNAHALTLGLGEAYFAPFLIFLGADNLMIGLLASVPLLAGSIAQLWVARELDHATNRRRLTLVPAVVQALSFAPLLALPLLVPTRGPMLALAGALIYFVAGSVVVPPWNSWIGDLVPPERRGDYFGHRNKLRTIVQVAGVLVAGSTLALARRHGVEAAGFVLIFVVAGAARLLSAWHIAAMVEPPYRPPALEEKFTFRDFVRRSPFANFGRFSIYAAVFFAATNLAGPYFTPYMLSDLGFGYIEFTAASTSFILAQAFTMHNWGKVGDRFGNRRVLALTGLSLPFVPMLWLLSTEVWAIVGFQILAGLIWAGFHMSVANFLFDAVTPGKRARCVAYYNTLMNVGLFAGALAGGALVPHLPSRLWLFGIVLELASPLQVLFLISGVVRLVVSLVLLPFIREVRSVEVASGWQVLIQIVGLVPIRGVRLSVFTGVHPSETPPPASGSEGDVGGEQ